MGRECVIESCAVNILRMGWQVATDRYRQIVVADVRHWLFTGMRRPP
jgi:hypothetical protein